MDRCFGGVYRCTLFGQPKVDPPHGGVPVLSNIMSNEEPGSIWPGSWLPSAEEAAPRIPNPTIVLLFDGGLNLGAWSNSPGVTLKEPQVPTKEGQFELGARSRK